MRDYCKISSQFWTGPTGKQIRALGPEAQVLALYLLTSRHSTMIGLYYLPLMYISVDTGLPIDSVTAGMERLKQIGFCAYDPDAEVVWVYEMARMQVGEDLKVNDNQCKAVANHYAEVPRNCFLEMFFERYQEAFHLTVNRVKPLQSPFKAPPEPLNNPLPTPSKPLTDPFEAPSKLVSSEQGVGNSESTRGVVQAQPLSNGEKPPLDAGGAQVPKKPPAPAVVAKPMPAQAPDRPPELAEDYVADDEVGGTTPEQKARRKAELAAVKRVFAYYLRKTDRNPKVYTLTRNRRQKGLLRLADALPMARGSLPDAEELLMACVDELVASDFHMGRISAQNPRNHRRYVEWEDHLFNTTEQFQRLLGQAIVGGPGERRAVLPQFTPNLKPEMEQKHG